MQTPLPETADELCAVAKDLERRPERHAARRAGPPRRDQGPERARQSRRYRIVHFATHGTLAGQLAARSEPGLILTPPAAATTEDDGYLSASEIAALKLDADWVILSACNTAAGGADGRRGAVRSCPRLLLRRRRALLVSHWEVDSDATVKLITTAVGAR